MNSTPPPPSGRTLAVFHLAETSGPSRSLVRELAWLGGGGPVEVVVPGPGAVAEAYAAVAEVTVLHYEALTAASGPVALGRAARQLARDARMFREHMRRTRPARVVAVTTMLPAVLLAARAERVPVLVYAAELVPRHPGAGRRIAGAAVLRLTRALAASIAASSNAVAAQFAGRGGPPVATVYPPIAEPDPAGDGDGFRARHSIDAGVPCIAQVGSISSGRGQDVLIRALPQLRRDLPGLRAVMVGEPHPRPADRAYRRELEDLAERTGVADALVWAGAVERIEDVYAAADAIVNPARRESFGRVGAEALLAGRPVIATRVEGLPEVLRDGTDALLVPPDSPDALARAVETLLSDARLAERLVTAGAQRVRERFSPEGSLAGFARAVGALSEPDLPSGAAPARAAEGDSA